MKYVLKLLRFLRNPQPYFDVAPYVFWGNMYVIRLYRKFFLPFIVLRVRRKIRKNKVNVVFLAMNPDMWRYDGVYRKLAKDPRFNPIIVTAMRNIPQMELRLKEQDEMLEYFSKRGYNLVRGYDADSGKWVNLKSLKPDIIFHTQPYNRSIERSFEFFNHLNVLHCYAPYFFQSSEVSWNWNNTLQQYCWKLFYVGEYQLEQCRRFSRVGKINAVPAGYCFEEEYVECVGNLQASNNAWRNDKRKRIIWAPHHSIMENEMFKVSSFLEISEFMVKVRDKYKNEVIFAFKPHPVLRAKLYDVWGKEKTDAYYADWAHSENSFDAQGDYHALFAGSDAMIHCSGSFTIEYLYTGKPVLYVYSKSRNPPDVGKIGDAALKAHYPANKESDIRFFIEKVVCGGDDPMRSVRDMTASQYIRSSTGKMFSENVFDNILEDLRSND